MAEIHVEAKKKATPIWFWILLFVIILAAIGAYVMFRDDRPSQNSVEKQQTSFVLNKNAELADLM
jgi:hypothetical protein